MANELTYYNAAKTALAQAASIDEIKDIKDKAEAIRLYAQQQKDTDFEGYAAEIKLRAMRRMGELSAALETAKPGPKDNSQRCELVAPKAEALKTAGISKDQAYRAEAIAAIPEEKFEDFIAHKKAEGKAVTADEIVRRVMADKKKQDNAAMPKSKAPKGQYGTIIIDPPWPMEKIERDVRPNQVAFDYPTMDLYDIMELEMPAADDCHLFIWTTHKFLPAAITACASWGFKYVLTMVWHKCGGYQPVGLPQYNCEFVVYARKGTPKFIDTKAFPCCFDGARREHSRKPEEFYDTIRRVTDEGRIDIFSREKRDGFDQHGNETDKF